MGPSGDLFVPEARAGCVIRIDSAGVGHLAVGGGRRSATCPACGVRLARPVDVAVGPDGTVYVLDQADFRVLAVRPDGTETTLAGGPGARLAYRRAIAMDAAGRLYVAESGGVSGSTRPGRSSWPAAEERTSAPARPPPACGSTVFTAIAAGPGGVLYLAEGYEAPCAAARSHRDDLALRRHRRRWRQRRRWAGHQSEHRTGGHRRRRRRQRLHLGPVRPPGPPRGSGGPDHDLRRAGPPPPTAVGRATAARPPRRRSRIRPASPSAAGTCTSSTRTPRRPSARSTRPGSSAPSWRAAENRGLHQPPPKQNRATPWRRGEIATGSCSVCSPAPVPVGLLRPGVGHLGSVGRPG